VYTINIQIKYCEQIYVYVDIFTTHTANYRYVIFDSTFTIAYWSLKFKCLVTHVIKGRVHCFSMQVVVNKYFLLNPEKNFGVDPSCRFREKRKKRTFNSEKWRHRAEDYATL